MPPRPTFTTPSGTFLGRHDEAAGVDRATGIRYARAERFARPEPVRHTPQEWVEATTWAPACPQPPGALPAGLVTDPMGGLGYDEHCQALSLTVPPGTRAGDGLPVMVWVHGGANLVGAGDSPLYDTAALVREQRVVVDVTYRLGVLGFLGGGDRPANLGLLHLLEAFRWVRESIEGFGGDPAQVTAFGESAGADAIAHLMIAEGGRGLFRRAILMSPPGAAARPGRGRRQPGQPRGRCRPDRGRPAGRRPLPRARPADAAPRDRRGHALRRGVRPPSTPRRGRRRRRLARGGPRGRRAVGGNARESALFLPRIPPLALAGRVPVVGGRMTEGLMRRLTARIYADDSREFAERHRGAGGRGLLYTLATGHPGELFESAHATDIPLLFPTRSVWAGSPLLAGMPWPEVEARGRELRALWAGFARTGALPAATPDWLHVEG